MATPNRHQAGKPSVYPSRFFGHTPPESVAAADLNGDGKPDLVTANEGSDSVSVLLNQGNGRFSAGIGYTVGNSPFSVVAADFNGDQMPDLAVANEGSNTVSLLLNQGNGAFAPVAGYAVGNLPYSIATGDFNGDGNPDLVVANEGSNTVSVLLSQGNGRFSSTVNYSVGSEPYSVAVADLNGDGKPDVAVADAASNTISVLLNRGDGTFGAAVAYASGSHPVSVVAADFNGDGKPDLAVANSYGSTVSVLLNQGNGMFAAAVSYAVMYNPVSVAAADFNGDGRPDLAVTNHGSNTVSVLLNRGNGTFAAAAVYAVGNSPESIVAADFNGDGKPDLAAANNGSGTVSVLLNQGDGTFGPAAGYAVGDMPYSVATADFNGDGNPDLATADDVNYPGAVTVLLNQSAPRTRAFPQAIAGADEVQLTWSPVPGASGYNIYRGTAPGAESATPMASDVSLSPFLDTDVTAGVMYYYTVTAVNGSYESTPSPEASAMPFLPIINATADGQSINLSMDADHIHIDWTASNAGGRVRIADALGLTINGDASNDSITLFSGNPLPNTLHLNGTFMINGLSGSNPLAGTRLDLSKGSAVYIAYPAGVDPLAWIKADLQTGYNAGTWTGAATPTVGVITSADAAATPTQLAIGYADSADSNSPDKVANTIEVKTTLIGDANLDGTVNLLDFLAAVRGFSNGNAWDQGDFNYDGSVNLSDFLALTRNFGNGLTTIPLSVTSSATPLLQRPAPSVARRRI